LSCLFGLDRIDKGIIRIKGKEVEITSPQKAMEYGLGLIPEDRRESGLILSRSVKDNIAITVLDQLSKGIILSGRKVKE
jgi:ABC-type sugar transport system ATPase subunit